MQGSDRGLDLIGAGLAVAHRPVDQRQRLINQWAVPQSAILVFEQDDGAIGIETGARAGMLYHHQRRQPHDLRFRGKKLQQQTPEPDRLLAEIGRDAFRAVHRRIAFVEDEIDHRCDGGEPVGTIGNIGRFESKAGRRDAGLGAGDALFHRRFADEKGAGNLLDRKARDDAQSQRDLLGCRQSRIAADEQQPKNVVAILRAIQPVGEIALLILEIGEHFLRWQRRFAGLTADLVDAAVAPDEDQPGGGIARRAALRPGLQCPDAGLLKCFLGRIEIAEIAQERAHRLRPSRNKREVDPGRVCHEGNSLGL
ncbi:hypothetical protein D9M70_471440 [compost metagenome]